MHDFEYEAPTKLSDAVQLLARSNGWARPLAGGTDLIDQMRVGRLLPQVVLDIKKIPELNELTVDADGLRVGAAVSCRRIYDEPQIAAHYAALADSCHIIGGVQIQSRATMGGNLCNSGPAADSIPSMIVLGGQCVIAGPGSTRQVPAESFCTGPGQNVLEPGELLVAINFKRPLAHSGSHYRRIIPRNEMDIAVVGVGAAVQLDPGGQAFVAARIGLGAVAPTPLMAREAAAALIGQPVNDQTIGQAAEVARQIVAPITDMRGTRAYRIHVTGVLTERVIKAAVARARGDQVSYRPGH